MVGQKWTIDQAARALGVSEKTIYRRIKSGQLKAALAGTPPTEHWMIEPAVGVTLDTPEPALPPPESKPEKNHESLIRILEGQLREKDRQISELHILLRESQGQMKLLLPEAAPDPSKNTKKRRWWPF